MFGSAESEHPRLTNGEIISDVIPTCDHNPPTLQTDRQTACDRNTALCTKVHRAVKRVPIF